jgi:nucleoside-diphosphate-sugar epimerase
MNKNLLITGGSGYLGAHLMEAASAAGWQVYATYHSRPFAPTRGIAVPLDLRDPDKTRAVLRNIHPQAVIPPPKASLRPRAHSIGAWCMFPAIWSLTASTRPTAMMRRCSQ